MASYGQPRRLNALTAVMILCGLAAGYWMWRFFPAYFDGFTVDHVLRETASATYKLSRLGEPERSKQLKILLDKARIDIIKLGNVTDPELTVNLDLEGVNVTVSADYTVPITHPVINKTTMLHFHKVEIADVKKVQWE
ncbi:MAG: hypothetical protein JWN44_6444 [Myxococcales bacterium]|nr:hypothetical protein [Myxococcales bacterium]